MDTSGKIATSFASVVDTGGKLATGVKYTGGKFATGLPQVSATLVANNGNNIRLLELECKNVSIS
jgi:hypothetical protein